MKTTDSNLEFKEKKSPVKLNRKRVNIQVKKNARSRPLNKLGNGRIDETLFESGELSEIDSEVTDESRQQLQQAQTNQYLNLMSLNKEDSMDFRRKEVNKHMSGKIERY